MVLEEVRAHYLIVDMTGIVLVRKPCCEAGKLNDPEK
jgi:hypothetical protein